MEVMAAKCNHKGSLGVCTASLDKTAKRWDIERGNRPAGVVWFQLESLVTPCNARGAAAWAGPSVASGAQ